MPLLLLSHPLLAGYPTQTLWEIGGTELPLQYSGNVENQEVTARSRALRRTGGESAPGLLGVERASTSAGRGCLGRREVGQGGIGGSVEERG